MRPRLTTDSQGRSVSNCILDSMLQAGETVARDHGTNVRDGRNTIAGAFQRVSWTKLVCALREKVEQLIVLRLVYEYTFDADAVLTSVLTIGKVLVCVGVRLGQVRTKRRA